MQTNRGFVPILAIVIVAAIVAGGGYYVYELAGGDINVNWGPLEKGNDTDTENTFNTKPDLRIGETSAKPEEPVEPIQPVACTLEAKICPDGSSISRTGPKCEFAQCPNIQPVQFKLPAGWKVYKSPNSLFSFSHPASLEVESEPAIPAGSYLEDTIYIYNQGDSMSLIEFIPDSYENIKNEILADLKEDEEENLSYGVKEEKITNKNNDIVRLITFLENGKSIGSEYFITPYLSQKYGYDVTLEVDFSKKMDESTVKEIVDSLHFDVPNLTTFIFEAKANAYLYAFWQYGASFLKKYPAEVVSGDFYSKICSFEPNNKESASYQFQEAVKLVGGSNVSCVGSKKEEFSFSIRLPSGEIVCADRGAIVRAKSLSQEPVCDRL